MLNALVYGISCRLHAGTGMYLLSVFDHHSSSKVPMPLTSSSLAWRLLPRDQVVSSRLPAISSMLYLLTQGLRLASSVAFTIIRSCSIKRYLWQHELDSPHAKQFHSRLFKKSPNSQVAAIFLSIAMYSDWLAEHWLLRLNVYLSATVTSFSW